MSSAAADSGSRRSTKPRDDTPPTKKATPMDRSNGHQLAQMTVTPLTMVEIGGEVRPVPDPTREAETRTGCMICNAGLEEALELPCLEISTDELLERIDREG